MARSTEQAQLAKVSLLKHFGIMFVLSVILQIIIAVRGNHIDTFDQLLLGAIAAYYAWYHYSAGSVLRKVRFARLVAHLVGFLIVNVSYHAHAFILLVSNNSAIRGDSSFAINSAWFGVLFGMTTFWGLGLLIHAVASIANRGFEELQKD